MDRDLKYSRWRRLPGLYRIGQRKPPDPGSDPQRLSLYLPAALLDRAASLAGRAGADSVQTYCEMLLSRAIQQEDARRRLDEFEAEHGPLEGLDAIANDPEYLTEWTARGPLEAAPENSPDREAAETEKADEAAPRSRDVVLRHLAARGEPPPALLASLRLGQPVDPDAARELLDALIDLERELRDHPEIDRQLAFVLHRLAFESQVLITDAFPTLGNDPATVETLRLVQESVDRVLSGEDIRYGSPDQEPPAY